MEDTGECGLHPSEVDGLGWSWRLRKARGGGRGVLSDSPGFDLNGLDPETASLCPSSTSSFRYHPPPPHPHCSTYWWGQGGWEGGWLQEVEGRTTLG